MAACDLCGKRCEACDLLPLKERFKLKGLSDICAQCDRWAKDQHTRLLEESSKELKRLLHERFALNQSTGEPRMKTLKLIAAGIAIVVVAAIVVILIVAGQVMERVG